MSTPPITFEDDHTQHWFPPRLDGPMEVSPGQVGTWMSWGLINQPAIRTVKPWGHQVDPITGRGAACSDHPHPQDASDFFIDMRLM